VSPTVEQRLADLAVTTGANVQPGQVVLVNAEAGHRQLARAIAESAYRRGARFVDVRYFDPYVKRSRIEHAPLDTLDYVPPWYGSRLLTVGEQHGAVISVTGLAAPGVLDGLDPERAGRDQLPFLKEVMTVISERSVGWTVVPCPTPGWAGVVFPELDPASALERLTADVVHVCRLDEPDPAVAWDERLARLEAVATALEALDFDAIRFRGPGTDLTIGLLPTSSWLMARWATVDGVRHMPNIPTEEVFTTPDPARADGVVRSTRPLVLADGARVEGLRVRFRAGRAVEIDADSGGDVMRVRASLDEGASRLGEIGLVDRDSRIGKLGTVYSETLLDENAVSHVALGSGYTMAVDETDRDRVNVSMAHVDFMVGGDDVAVTGLTRAGTEIPILAGGDWQMLDRRSRAE
jgi:aminopeptidase